MLFFRVVVVLLNSSIIVASSSRNRLSIAESEAYDTFERLSQCCNDWCQQDNIFGTWIGRNLDPSVPRGNAFDDDDSCERCSCSMVYFSAETFYKFGGYKMCQATNFNKATCDCEKHDPNGNRIYQGMKYCQEKFGTVTSIDGVYSSSSGVCFCSATVDGGYAGRIKKTVWRSNCMEHGSIDWDGKTQFSESICSNMGTSNNSKKRKSELTADAESANELRYETTNELRADVQTKKGPKSHIKISKGVTANTEISNGMTADVEMRNIKELTTNVEATKELTADVETTSEPTADVKTADELTANVQTTNELTTNVKTTTVLLNSVETEREIPVPSWDKGFLRGLTNE